MTGDGCLMPAVLFNCCPLCTVCLWAPARRKQLRTDLGGLPEEPFGDCLFWCLCTSCANCQEARELKKRQITSNMEYKASASSTAAAANEAAGVAA